MLEDPILLKLLLDGNEKVTLLLPLPVSLSDFLVAEFVVVAGGGNKPSAAVAGPTMSPPLFSSVGNFLLPFILLPLLLC